MTVLTLLIGDEVDHYIDLEVLRLVVVGSEGQKFRGVESFLSAERQSKLSRAGLDIAGEDSGTVRLGELDSLMTKAANAVDKHPLLSAWA